ncbi:MAG TPA: cytochrome c oxidase subunit II [Candidatus Limnocylindria bacterium]|nr:cytochrome c oxidase subunit II [Candidatus Limnocylindria bacterium]
MSRFALMPEQASTVAGEVDALFLSLVGVTIFFSLLIAGLLVRFMLVYRRRSATDVPPRLHVPLWLEAGWSIVPLAITMMAFFWGARIYAALVSPPADALEVFVVGRQWMWKMQHLEGRREIDELHVPVGRPVKLTMTSEDVIHSFYVPAFRVKQDAVPGRYTTVWFEATKPGTYHLFCAEYCGTLHSGMIGRVVAMEPAEFQAWLSGAAPGGTRGMSVAALGEQLFQAQGCASCHKAGAAQRGPALEGLYGRSVVLADGRTVVADDAYLRESILDSNAKIVAGYQPLMPTYRGLLTEEQVLQLITYLKGLGTEAES